MKTPFKVGDKVYCIIFGWGRVHDVHGTEGDAGDNYPIEVMFKDIDGEDILKSYSYDGRYYTVYHTQPTLSFTEYTLDGFSQERPMELPEIGEEIMVSDDSQLWTISQFTDYSPKNKKPVRVITENGNFDEFKYFKRLR